MGLYLTETDRRHLLAAQETMLAPLAYEDRGAWMLAVNDRLRDLVGADHTIAFFLDEDGFEYVCSDTEEGLRRLELAVPAFEAGVRAWRRMTDHRDLIESLKTAVAVFGPEGRALFRSRGLDRLLRDEPTSSEILSAIEDLARGRSAHRPLHRRKSADRKWTNTREVATERGTYRLWASSLPTTLFGTEAVLVEVDRRDRGLPPAEQVQARFGLSPREAEVALLLAEGLDNRTIAERLHISPHTARRHTERVLRGLGVPSRAAVAMRLLRLPRSRP